MTDYGALIPGMRDNQGADWIDVENWLYTEGRYGVLIACGWLFWPTFIQYEDCVIRLAPCNDHAGNYSRLTSQGPVERGYVEERLNRIEIADIISPSRTGQLSIERAVHIGKLLEQMWKSKLSVDFPDRNFQFSFLVCDEDKVDDLELTFCQSDSYIIKG